MKNTFSIIMGITLIFASAKDGEIGFRYGVLSKPTDDSNDITVLSDSSVIHTGDYLQINIAYTKGTDFCGIYKGAQDEYWLFFPREDDEEQNLATSPDTLHKTVMTWNEMLQPPGMETFYFINSSTSLSELVSLLESYATAPPKGQIKLATRIQEKINSFDPNVQDDISSIVNRLDKPVTGGVAFRGEDDDGLKALSVTHECSGTGGTAFQKVVLIHQ